MSSNKLKFYNECTHVLLKMPDKPELLLIGKHDPMFTHYVNTIGSKMVYYGSQDECTEYMQDENKTSS